MKNDRLNGSCWLSVIGCWKITKGLPFSFLRTLVFAITLILLFTRPAFSQQTWWKTYGGIGDDYGYSVQQTSDGGYIVTGYTFSYGHGSCDVYLIKTDAQGDTLWTKTYGGTSYEFSYSVQQTSDGGYIVAGTTNSYGNGDEDVYLIKTNAQGDTLWTRTYGGAIPDYGYSVQQTSDGGYIVAGWTDSYGNGYPDVWLIKTNAQGDTLWTRTYGDTIYDNGYSVQQTSDGGYIVTGSTWSYGNGAWDVYLIKTDAQGDTLWTRTYGGTYYDYGYSVQQTPDGGYILAGRTDSYGHGSNDVYLIKTNAQGDTLWTRTYGGTYDDYGYSVQQTSDGGYIVAGSTNSYGHGGQDVWLIKTNASGDTLWTRTYGGTNGELGYSVQQTSDGGYVIAGSTNSFGAGGYDVYLIKTDANGNVGVETPVRQLDGSTVRQLKATPNPFTSFAVVPGQEKEMFELYNIAGRKVGTYRGERIGWDTGPGVYFLRTSGKPSTPVRIVKVR